MCLKTTGAHEILVIRLEEPEQIWLTVEGTVAGIEQE